MYIEEKELFNELFSDPGKSLYDPPTDRPLYKQDYFFKTAYCPKSFTIEQALQKFGQINDADIQNLPDRPEPENSDE